MGAPCTFEATYGAELENLRREARARENLASCLEASPCLGAVFSGAKELVTTRAREASERGLQDAFRCEQQRLLLLQGVEDCAVERQLAERLRIAPLATTNNNREFLSEAPLRAPPSRRPPRALLLSSKQELPSLQHHVQNHFSERGGESSSRPLAAADSDLVNKIPLGATNHQLEWRRIPQDENRTSEHVELEEELILRLDLSNAHVILERREREIEYELLRRLDIETSVEELPGMSRYHIDRELNRRLRIGPCTDVGQSATGPPEITMEEELERRLGLQVSERELAL